MKNSNITKLDQKGRILIPKHIRDVLKADDGTEIILIPDNENSQVKLLPLLRDKTAEIRILIDDAPGSLAKIADLFSQYGVNIVMSESRTLVRGKTAEWDIITDISELNGEMETIKEKILNSGVVKKMEILD
ncbi:MAG: ACT domain-containing protein [Candidatus Aenigmarchaeota archaeon]|nr:ACT domain-containing protein [Candidatus Aenigmarchaeota archaeon]